MSIIRKAIRYAIANVLKDNTDAGGNVFASRTRKLTADNLPAILVYTTEEAAEEFIQAPRELKRTLTVRIEIAARADEELDDTLDDLAQEVEDILSENQTLDDVASDVILTRTEIVLNADGDNQHGACVMSYDVTYYTKDVSDGEEGPGVPDANVLRVFARAGVEWRPNGATADSPVTKDLIQLPQ